MTSVLKDFDEKINKAVDDTNDDGAGNAKDFSKKELDKESKKRKAEDKKEDTKKSVETKDEAIEKSADLDRNVIEDIIAKHVDAKFSDLDKKMDKCIELCGKMDMGKSIDNLMTKDEADGIVTTFAKAYDAVEKMHSEITKSANDMQELIAKSAKGVEQPTEKSAKSTKEEAKVEKSAKEHKEDKVADENSEAQVEKSASYAAKEGNGAESKEATVEKSVEPAEEKEVKKSYTMGEVNDLLGSFVDRMHSEALSKSISATEYQHLNDLATDVQYQRVDEDQFDEFISYATGKDAVKAI